MGHIKIRYAGKSYPADEYETIETLKTKVLNLTPEAMLVNEDGRLLSNREQVKDCLKDGECVMPLVRPEYGV